MFVIPTAHLLVVWLHKFAAVELQILNMKFCKLVVAEVKKMVTVIAAASFIVCHVGAFVKSQNNSLQGFISIKMEEINKICPKCDCAVLNIWKDC